jgi:competence CoiA-like predicted nuclease
MSESYRHADVKADMYYSLLMDEDIFAPSYETRIGRTRTDVTAEVNGLSIAIEIQHTRIPIPSILRRMREHTKAGMHTLWLITPETLLHEERARSLNWVFFIQRLQDGVIFLPSDNQTIIPARVDNTLKIVRNEIVAGKRKYLDQIPSIEIEKLKFMKNEEFDLNICTYNEWWFDAYVDLIH